MKTLLTYLAGPIYGQSDESCFEWRKEATAVLRAKNIMTLDPTVRDYRGKEQENIDRIVIGDKRAIMAADTVLCYSPEPSYGTAMEVFFAWSMHKQVLTVTTSQSPWINYHSTLVVSTLKEALDLLEKKE